MSDAVSIHEGHVRFYLDLPERVQEHGTLPECQITGNIRKTEFSDGLSGFHDFEPGKPEHDKTRPDLFRLPVIAKISSGHQVHPPVIPFKNEFRREASLDSGRIFQAHSLKHSFTVFHVYLSPQG